VCEAGRASSPALGYGLPGTVDPARPVASLDRLFFQARCLQPIFQRKVRALAVASGGGGCAVPPKELSLPTSSSHGSSGAEQSLRADPRPVADRPDDPQPGTGPRDRRRTLAATGGDAQIDLEAGEGGAGAGRRSPAAVRAEGDGDSEAVAPDEILFDPAGEGGAGAGRRSPAAVRAEGGGDSEAVSPDEILFVPAPSPSPAPLGPSSEDGSAGLRRMGTSGLVFARAARDGEDGIKWGAVKSVNRAMEKVVRSYGQVTQR
jgi:hypothetical protein